MHTGAAPRIEQVKVSPKALNHRERILEARERAIEEEKRALAQAHTDNQLHRADVLKNVPGNMRDEAQHEDKHSNENTAHHVQLQESSVVSAGIPPQSVPESGYNASRDSERAIKEAASKEVWNSSSEKANVVAGHQSAEHAHASAHRRETCIGVDQAKQDVQSAEIGVHGQGQAEKGADSESWNVAAQPHINVPATICVPAQEKRSVHEDSDSSIHTLTRDHGQLNRDDGLKNVAQDRTNMSIQSAANTRSADIDESKHAHNKNETSSDARVCEEQDTDGRGQTNNARACAVGEEICAFGGKSEGVLGMCWHMDMLVTCGSEGDVCVWRCDHDAQSSPWTCMWHTRAHVGNVNCVASSGADFVSAGDDGTVRVWRIKDGAGECVKVLDAAAEQKGAGDDETKGVTCVYVHGGRVFCGVHVQNEVLAWDSGTWRLAGRLRGHQSWVSSMCTALGGDLLVTTSFDSSLRVWSIKGSFMFAACQALVMREASHRQPLLGVAALGARAREDDTRQDHLVTIAEDGRLAVWVLDTSQGALSARHESTAVHAEGTMLAAGWSACVFVCLPFFPSCSRSGETFLPCN